MEGLFQWFDRFVQALAWQAVLSKLQWVDWCVFVFVAGGLLYGIRKGLMSELAAIFELSAVVYAVLEYYGQVGFLLKKFVVKTAALDTLALPSFILLALAAAFAASVVRFFLGKWIHTTTAKPLHIAGGALLGCVHGFVLVSFMVQAVLLTPFVKVKKALDPGNSYTGVYAANLAPSIHRNLSEVAAKFRAPRGNPA